jgi:hypothetical protein
MGLAFVNATDVLDANRTPYLALPRPSRASAQRLDWNFRRCGSVLNTVSDSGLSRGGTDGASSYIREFSTGAEERIRLKTGERTKVS